MDLTHLERKLLRPLNVTLGVANISLGGSVLQLIRYIRVDEGDVLAQADVDLACVNLGIGRGSYGHLPSNCRIAVEQGRLPGVRFHRDGECGPIVLHQDWGVIKTESDVHYILDPTGATEVRNEGCHIGY